MTDQEDLQVLMKKAMERPGVEVILKLQEQFRPVLSRTQTLNRPMATSGVSNSTS